jgi:hypothetical protein
MRQITELKCRTITAYSLCKPPIFLEEPAAREPMVFANADAYELGTCQRPVCRSAEFQPANTWRCQGTRLHI